MARLALALLALAPFALVYVHHYTAGEGATGFIQVDMPFYAANGRAIFERGDGLLYPNAYDPDPAAPAIYFYWLIWLYGFGIVQLGLDPGHLFVGMGAAGALLFALVTLRLVEAVAAGTRHRVKLYLLVMWGGGLLALARVATNLAGGVPPLDDLLAFDPASGGWFLNWGRNVLYPMEALYHVLSGGCLLAVLRGRWGLGVVAASLLAATHPFSGAQVLYILLTFATMRLVMLRDRRWVLRWIASALPVAAFAAYNVVYLPGFPQHRALQEAWHLPWTIPALSAALAWLPMGVLAGWRLWCDRGALDERVGFLLTCFAVSLAFSNYDALVEAVVPAHFTRGYVWLPLCLLALPRIQGALDRLASWPRPVGAAVLAGTALVAVSDNAAAVGTVLGVERPGFYLSRDEREMLRWIDDQGQTGVLLGNDQRLNYLAATYTPLRPYVGHHLTTPDLRWRYRQMLRWLDGELTDPFDPEPDLLLLKRGAAIPELDLRFWKPLHANVELVLLGRR
jgi:hypothetical protein